MILSSQACDFCYPSRMMCAAGLLASLQTSNGPIGYEAAQMKQDNPMRRSNRFDCLYLTAIQVRQCTSMCWRRQVVAAAKWFAIVSKMLSRLLRYDDVFVARNS